MVVMLGALDTKVSVLPAQLKRAKYFLRSRALTSAAQVAASMAYVALHRSVRIINLRASDRSSAEMAMSARTRAIGSSERRHFVAKRHFLVLE